MQYFIDFENTHDEGLISISPLPETDTVYLFYTAQTPKINLDTLAAVNATIRYIKVPAGKQSLDQHLITFLGFAIAQGGKADGYVIVSNDNGFDPIAAFWCGRGYAVSRKQKQQAKKPEPPKKPEPARRPEQIKKPDNKRQEQTKRSMQPVKPEPAAEAIKEPEKVPEAVQPVSVPAEIPAESESRPLQETVNAPVEAAAATETVEEAAMPEIAAEPAPEAQTEETKPTEQPAAARDPAQKRDNEKRQQGRRARNNGRKPDAGKGQNAAKGPEATAKPEEPAAERTEPAIAEPENEAPKTAGAESMTEAGAGAATAEPVEAPEEQSRIAILLTEAGADSRIVRDVSALVEKHAENKHEGKALIYRGMVRKYGQKRGLTYYNVIKKEL